jgi:Ca2+-binding RTX toxin-like protein
VDYSENDTSVRVDLATQSVSFPGKKWSPESLVSIEAARTGSGDDILIGSDGANLLLGGKGEDEIHGGGGNDTIDGGGNTDEIDGGAGHDVISYADTATAVTVDLKSQKASFPEKKWSSERFASIEGAVTGIGNDKLIGNRKDNTFWGGEGNDVFVAGRDADLLHGGSGQDTFRFKQTAQSGGGETDTLAGSDGALALEAPGDGIGDLIDLRKIDANTTRSGNQAFTFGDDHGKGRLWLSEDEGVTYVHGNVDGDRRAEFELALEDGSTEYREYSEKDFLL